MSFRGEQFNFYIYYEVDDDEVPTALRLEEYNIEREGGWVLLEAAAIVEAGLCRALGNASSRLCMNESSHTSVRRELIDDMSFRYCEFSWGEPRHRESRIGSYLEHLWRAERASRAVAT